MKVILSRKGFDSGAGGYPSVIMPDGRIISFPIPDDEEKETGVKYKDLSIYDGMTYLDLMEQLGIKRHKESKVHLDPDLSYQVMDRKDGWRPVFGQSSAAQTHLSNNGIGLGDIFLYFGWFRNVDKINGKYSYVKGTDKHMI